MLPENFAHATGWANSENFRDAWDMSSHILQTLWTEKAKTAMQQQAEAGILPGYAPLGYRNVRRGKETLIERDPETFGLIWILFHLVERGFSIRKAGAMVHAKGLRSRNGKPLGPSALYAILTNPFYIGKMRYKGELIEGLHEPVVDRATFKIVQRKLKNRKGKIK